MKVLLIFLSLLISASSFSKEKISFKITKMYETDEESYSSSYAFSTDEGVQFPLQDRDVEHYNSSIAFADIMCDKVFGSNDPILVYYNIHTAPYQSYARYKISSQEDCLALLKCSLQVDPLEEDQQILINVTLGEVTRIIGKYDINYHGEVTSFVLPKSCR